MSGRKRKIDSEEKKTTKKKPKILFKEKHPEIFKMVHPTKNDLASVEKLTCGSNVKVWFICPVVCGDHIWQAKICNITKTRKEIKSDKSPGCPFCYGCKTCECQSAGKLYPHLKEQFDEKKNGNLNIMKLAPNSNTKIWWYCPNSTCQHIHSWFTSPNSRILGTGCPFCCTPPQKTCPCDSFATLYPHLLLEFKKELNLGVDVYSIPRGSGEIIKWKCSKSNCNHHVWECELRDRTLKESNCPFCANQKTCICDSFATKFPELLKEFDEKLNGDVDPFALAPKGDKCVWWNCTKCEHKWKTSIVSRTHEESGCPKCSSSKMEKSINKILKGLNIVFEIEKRFPECKDKRALPFDIYIEKSKILIEMDGAQHFQSVDFWGGPSGLKQRQHYDQIKNDYAKKEGINLLRISCSESKNIELHFKKFLETVEKSKDRVEMFVGKEYNNLTLTGNQSTEQCKPTVSSDLTRIV
jgi:hypothetical protein